MEIINKGDKVVLRDKNIMYGGEIGIVHHKEKNHYHVQFEGDERIIKLYDRDIIKAR